MRAALPARPSPNREPKAPAPDMTRRGAGSRLWQARGSTLRDRGGPRPTLNQPIPLRWRPLQLQLQLPKSSIYNYRVRQHPHTSVIIFLVIGGSNPSRYNCYSLPS
jgi:hypothetical protein